MLIKIILFLFVWLYSNLSFSAPFLACDPYNGSGAITDVEVMYKPFEQVAVVLTGTYTISGNNAILFDLTDQYTPDPRYFRARWKSDAYPDWSNWSDTGVLKGRGGIAPSKGTGSITPGKGTGSISPYYDDILFILYEESNYTDLLFSPIYGIMNMTNTRR